MRPLAIQEPADAVGPANERALRTRIRAGLVRARAAGKRLGRPRVEYDVQQAAALRAAGMSYRAIGRKLGIAVAVIHAALTRRS